MYVHLKLRFRQRNRDYLHPWFVPRANTSLSKLRTLHETKLQLSVTRAHLGWTTWNLRSNSNFFLTTVTSFLSRNMLINYHCKLNRYWKFQEDENNKIVNVKFPIRLREINYQIIFNIYTLILYCCISIRKKCCLSDLWRLKLVISFKLSNLQKMKIYTNKNIYNY